MTAERIVVTNARGASAADVARRAGLISQDASDADFIAYLAGLAEDVDLTDFPSSVTAYSAGGTGPAARFVQDKLRESVSILDYRTGTDTSALEKALATGKAVHLPAGRGTGPGGAYMLDMARITFDGAYIYGDGPGSVIRPANNTVKNALWADSEDEEETIKGITIWDVKFLGSVEDDGFAEHFNLLELSGVEDVWLERCYFIGFRSDGFMLEGGERFGIENPYKRTNRNVNVRDCVFDGINKDNRNCISVTGFDGPLRITNCTFRNSTRSNMPGAIDFESNDADWFIAKDAIVEGCHFENIGGSAGCITIVMNPLVDVAPQNIAIRNNTFRGNTGGGEIYTDLHKRFTDADDDCAIVFEGNKCFDGTSPFRFISAKGVTIRNNRFSDYSGTASLGPLAAYYVDEGVKYNDLKNFVLEDNTFLRTGASGAAVTVSSIDGLEIRGNRFERYGPNTSDAIAVFFTQGLGEDGDPENPITGASSNVAIEDNTFVHGISNAFAVYPVSHSYTPATNTFSRNRTGTLNYAFSATSKGSTLQAAYTWNPASLVDGAGETSGAITVAGAAFGDTVVAGAPYDLQGITCSAYVSAANTVRIRLQNETGGTIDLASGDWFVRVTKMADGP